MPVRVSVDIEAAPARVWEEVRHIERHVKWMADAVAIRFTSTRRSGVGTTFDCETKVGPISLTDRMEITEWRDEDAMGVRHVGVVTGHGLFTLARSGSGTTFTWEETLSYPWWLGGRVGGLVGDRVMAGVWRRNLRRLKAQVERPG